jgi:hypothetical protein
MDGGRCVDTMVVCLAHASVADYLESDGFKKRFPNYDLSKEMSHTFLAQSCVGYLLHFKDHPLAAETFPNFPLASYSAIFWSHRHLLRCHDRAVLLTSIMCLLEPGTN